MERFLAGVLTLAIVALVWYFITSPAKAISYLVAVLIIAVAFILLMKWFERRRSNNLSSKLRDPGQDDKDTYFVAVKVFLEREGKLLILKDNFGDWDLPGGRIKKDEFETPINQIIKRKMSEELGDDIQYTIGKPVVFMRHERQEAIPGNPIVRIFAVGYSGTLNDGEIKTSERHPEFLWVDPKNFRPEDYFKGGWLKGVQEYLALQK